MLNCKEASRLVSESLDRKLSLWQRVGLWAHLAMCKLCSGFANDVKRIHEAARRHAEEVENDAGAPGGGLSPEARERIQRALEGRDS